MSSILVYAVFLLIPLAAVAAFVVCLIRFLVGKGHGLDAVLLRPRKIATIVTGAVAGGLVMTMVSFIALVYYMISQISM